MIEVNVHEAKTQLSRLIEAVLRGEDVTIKRRNQPVARLVAIEPAQSERELGWGGAAGFRMDEDFDAPLEDFADYR